jgi:probable rRNA maturation factor
MILNRQRTVRIALRPLELFLNRVRRALGLQKMDATICFVSDAEIARMNEAFRRKKGSTDVLSFPAVERRRPVRLPLVVKGGQRTAGGRRQTSDRPSREDLGDIAISPAAARHNARRGGRTVQSELQILMLHGILHLLGYDHETDQGQMNRLEQRLRRKFGLA